MGSFIPRKMQRLELKPSPLNPWSIWMPRFKVGRARFTVLAMAAPTT
jgi:hypothetical protein